MTSLIASIREQRQDLFPNSKSSKPISLVAPIELTKGNITIKTIH